MGLSQWLPGWLRLLQNKVTIGAKSAIIMERVLFYKVKARPDIRALIP